jgi:arylsulfatase A-like enzyme
MPPNNPLAFFRRLGITIIASAVLFNTSAVRAGASPKRLNFVFVLADDLGWRDLGCYGSTFYETPNLDRLAKTGLRFTDAYAACCVCSPTRASILTGKYPARLHLTDWLPGRRDRPDQKLLAPKIIQQLPLDEITLAEALQQAGYCTGFFGKWHLGGPGFYPEQQGFQVNLGGCELGHPPSYFSPYKIPTLPDGPAGEYLTDRLTDEAIKFVHDCGNKPFLLYLAHYAVHNPQQAKSALIEEYRTKVKTLPPSSRPEFLPEGKTSARQIQNQPVYAAMIQSLDESIGRLMQTLADLHLDQNTIVIFFSDNGGLSTAEGSPTSNVPLRGGKGWPYEGGVREPLLVRWPGVTKPGTVCSTPVISTDFYPTLLDIAQLPLRPTQHLDGISLVPLLRRGSLPDRPLFWHYPHYSNQGAGQNGAMRSGNFKLVEWFEEDRAELFDLKHDPGEQHDLSSEQRDKTANLREQLHQWRKSIGASMPQRKQ